MEDTLEIPELPETKPEIKVQANIRSEIKEDPKIKELTEALTNIQFLADPVRVNSVLYQGISLILEKLTKLESDLKSGKPISL